MTVPLSRHADVHVTFDIDAMDPVIAPGAGTPEVGGLPAFLSAQIMPEAMGFLHHRHEAALR